MLYVARDKDGKICELHPMPSGTAQERQPSDSPEVLQFIHERWRQSELTELDRDFIRALEDTIELLIAKGVILFTDLPVKVQEKLLRRKEIRGQTRFAANYGEETNDVIKL